MEGEAIGEVRRGPGPRLSDADLEEWLVGWIPLERDRLVREYDEAADRWAEQHARHGDRDGRGRYLTPHHPGGHPDLLWAEQMMRDAREELLSHDRFAEWATGWLTRRWEGRMRRLVELW